MSLHSDLDDRLIDSLKKKLISLENTPSSGFNHNVGVQMLSLHPACLLKGFITTPLPNGHYQISKPCGTFVANCITAVSACERLSSSYGKLM